MMLSRRSSTSRLFQLQRDILAANSSIIPTSSHSRPHFLRSVRVKSTYSTSNQPHTSAISTTINNNNNNGGGSRNLNASTAAGIAFLSLSAGYVAGRASSPTSSTNPDLVLPNGYPRSCCCDAPPQPQPQPLTPAQQALPATLSQIVSPNNVLTPSSPSFASYLIGARLGRSSSDSSRTLAIASPPTLTSAVQCIQAAVNAGCIVVPQGANTGLTGGSVPRDQPHHNDESRHRPSVVLSTRNLTTSFPIDNGRRVLCLAGCGIATLSRNLTEWGYSDRSTHSTLGSTFLDPTVAAGVAFGSGGTRLRVGPAYTDRALYVKVHRDKWGEYQMEVVNTLGVEGIEDSDFKEGCGSVLEQLDVYVQDVLGGYRRAMAVSSRPDRKEGGAKDQGKGTRGCCGTRKASDTDYAERVCDLNNEVSRCNAHTHGEDCNRSEGKVFILATVHDTFPKAQQQRSYWISFRTLDLALAFRREVCLANPADLPMSVEYMDRDAVDVIDRSGRVLANVIQWAGMESPLVRQLWNVKLVVEQMGWLFSGAETVCDKFLHVANGFMPGILPKRMADSAMAMDHHIALTVGEFGNGELQRTMERIERFQRKYNQNNDRADSNRDSSSDAAMTIHECESGKEELSLNAFRFVAAPAFRTWCVGEGVQGFSVDYALPKNDGKAPVLDRENDDNSDEAMKVVAPLKRMRYSHFGCNVVHEDVAYSPGVDVHQAKMELKRRVEKDCGGKLPAEHGHGIEYKAPKETQDRWKRMDPENVMNPGIGGLSSVERYGEKL